MTAPIRVCHLIKGLGRGGAEALLPQLARGGNGSCRYAVGYFLPWKDALVADLEAAGAGVRCFGAASSLGMFARVGTVARWLRRERADLVHCHLPLAGVVGRLAGRLARVPVVYTEHNLQERYHPLTRRANLLTWRLQDQAIAVSAEVAGSIRRHAGDRVPLRVVRNGIEIDPRPGREAAGAAVRRALGIPAAAPVVGTVAVFRRQKRLDLWLEAARALLAVVPDTHFLLVGDGPLRGQAEALAGRLGLAPRAHFPGLQEDVRPFLAAMDLYLISSEFEGLPLALLEAMAAELAVVSTPVGGIPEVIEDGASGLLVPFGDPAGLAAAAGGLLADPVRRASLGRTGRGRVEAGFGIARMAAELREIYEAVLHRRTPPEPEPASATGSPGQ